jgi:alkylated DNA repair protein alkB family protein 8
MVDIETKYVKESYNQIAKDFDRTRYNHWGSVKRFINSLPSNSLILDAGCGNGKNMLFENMQFIGCDISEELVKI